MPSGGEAAAGAPWGQVRADEGRVQRVCHGRYGGGSPAGSPRPSPRPGAPLLHHVQYLPGGEQQSVWGCPSPPLPGVFLAVIIVRRPGFPQAFSFPPARSLCKAGSDGARGWGVSAQTHTHIHTHAHTQHPSAAAPGKMPIPLIQARDPLAGGRGMGGVSGDHVGPGSGCRAPGWRRLSPPARRSVRPSVRPRSLPARTARWARPGPAAAAERVRPPPHGPPPSRVPTCGRRDTRPCFSAAGRERPGEGGGKKSLPS